MIGFWLFILIAPSIAAPVPDPQFGLGPLGGLGTLGGLSTFTDLFGGPLFGGYLRMFRRLIGILPFGESGSKC